MKEYKILRIEEGNNLSYIHTTYRIGLAREQMVEDVIKQLFRERPDICWNEDATDFTSRLFNELGGRIRETFANIEGATFTLFDAGKEKLLEFPRDMSIMDEAEAALWLLDMLKLKSVFAKIGGEVIMIHRDDNSEKIINRYYLTLNGHCSTR